jgi:hypothetical protein
VLSPSAEAALSSLATAAATFALELLVERQLRHQGWLRTVPLGIFLRPKAGSGFNSLQHRHVNLMWTGFPSASNNSALRRARFGAGAAGSSDKGEGVGLFKVIAAP